MPFSAVDFLQALTAGEGEWLIRVDLKRRPRGLRTAGNGALQPMGDDAAYG
jgi:hypothetical protein